MTTNVHSILRRSAASPRTQMKSFNRINTIRAAAVLSPAGTERNLSSHTVDSLIANQQRPAGGLQLPHGLDPAFLPRHVALFLDGHNRWRKEKAVPTEVAFEASGRAWKEIVKVSAAWGISAFTTFFFSTENWDRPEDEVQKVLQAYTVLMHGVCDELV
ncbi:hypothetical protein GOP47_0009483, partial [Adiantum capillus-veneris]